MVVYRILQVNREEKQRKFIKEAIGNVDDFLANHTYYRV